MSDNSPTILTMTDRHGLIDAVQPREKRPGVQRIMVADGARVVVFRFAAGQVLAEHKAAFPILVQSIDGHIRFTADGRTIDLHPGDIAHLSARLLHAVEAVTDATLLLIKLLGVKSIRDVQNQRDQLLVVRCGAQPRFGRDASTRAGHPVVPHAR